MTTRLFVYGSLMRGHVNAGHMDGAFIEGTARTAAGFALYRVGAYPALARAQDGSVGGEVYRVGSVHLARLDEFEGCPDLYRREEIALADGSRADAYVMDPARATAHPRIAGGNWVPSPDPADSGPD